MVKRSATDAAPSHARGGSAKKVKTSEPKGILKKQGKPTGAAKQAVTTGSAASKPTAKQLKDAPQSTRFAASSKPTAAVSKKPQDVKGKAKAVDQAQAGEPSLRAGMQMQEPVATAFEVVAGSYERLLYGLHCTLSGAGDAASVDMQPVFQFPAHLTCVKTVAASPNGRWLATGAADEVIKVWDLKRRKELGGLLGHEGDITSLTFSTDKYLVSTSADGTLSLFRTKDWSLLRKFKGHKGKVNYAAVHPQGRVALSVGKDRCLRMWDLLGRSTGKSSTSTKLGAEADIVRWNIDGTKLAVLLDREIRVFSTDMNRLATLTSLSRFHDLQFANIDGQEVFLVGCEDRKVRIYTFVEAAEDAADGKDDADENEKDPLKFQCFAELVGHANRVKAVSVTKVLNQHTATTISSDGSIHVYSLANLAAAIGAESPLQIKPVQRYDTKGSRLTCLTVVGVRDDRTTRGTVDGGDVSSDDSDDDSEGNDSELELDEDAADDMEELEREEADDLEGEDDEDEEDDDDEAADEQNDEEWGGIDE